jgi:hypothetical protein
MERNASAQEKGEALLNNMIGKPSSPALNQNNYQRYRDIRRTSTMSANEALTNYMNTRREFGINAEPTRKAYARYRAIKNLNIQ